MASTTLLNMKRLQHLYSFLKVQQDDKQGSKVLDLIGKLDNREMVVGFAGHFSAGKSTLINKLLASEILPSSPIPTSANIVRLKTGDPYTIAKFKDEPPVKYVGDSDIDTIKALCKDGDAVTGLEISRPAGGLPDHVSVVDTPGVDSANDADRLITESSLHMMDYLFYVMDYNHVQSEVNLMFLLEMQQRGTPFSIVINQVDKHVEAELTFEKYKASVEQAIHEWGIHPEHVYYISLKDFALSTNEFSLLEHDFKNLFKRSYETIERQAELKAEMLIEESVRQFTDEQYEKKEPLLERKAYIEENIEGSHVTEEMLDWNKNLIEEAQQQFDERVKAFISNAYLMPSALREYAEAYLEALQPGFKVGILFTSKKTAAERAEREAAFYGQLKDSIETNLKWPLRDRMVKLMDDYSISDPDISGKVHAVDFTYPKERLKALVESGASVTGAYVLRYTEQIAKDIQQQARHFIEAWRTDFIMTLKHQREKVYDQHHSVFQMLEEQDDIQQQLEGIEQEIRSYRESLYDHFTNLAPTSAADISQEDLIKRQKEIHTKKLDIPLQQSEPRQAEVPSVNAVQKPSASSSVNRMLQKAAHTLETIQPINGLENLYEQLSKKRDRLVNRHYTVALFGAFSAGKSSFANALLGDHVLPVSPNPTTATINKISPPSENKADQTIEAVIKNEQQMLADLSPVLESVKIEANHILDVFDQARALSEESWKVLDQKQHSFLRAFIEGFEFMRPHMGQHVTVAWEDFSSYVAEEEKSCFIESMELFYDCAWTRAGVTLVDTPGADSVNARHTDVSFEYIKDADAVLFVTYYNHPFSKADQSFLTQLGRVKDSFAMDKMFFIINAADLANSENERRQVETYVKEQLNGFHIRLPRLFSLSSLNALKEKQSRTLQTSGFKEFEGAFSRFLDEELADMLIQSIETDINHIKEMIAHFIETSRLDEKERQQEWRKLQQQKEAAIQIFKNRQDTGAEETIQNKVDKQIHYVHERMMLNFNDLYKRHFNPSTINGKDEDVKVQLKNAQSDLLNDVSFEMKQEVKAVGVRLERLLEDLTIQVKRRLEKDLTNIRPTLNLQKEDWIPVPLPEVEGEIILEEKQQAAVLKSFKNTKAFFEKNEKETMKEELAASISPELAEQLEKQTRTLASHYKKQWHECYKRAVNEWEDQVIKLFQQMFYHMEHPVDVSELEQASRRLS